MSGMAYTCLYSGTHLGQMYTFIVSALNCGTQRGQEANVTVNLQGKSTHSLLYFDRKELVWVPLTTAVFRKNPNPTK